MYYTTGVTIYTVDTHMFVQSYDTPREARLACAEMNNEISS